MTSSSILVSLKRIGRVSPVAVLKTTKRPMSSSSFVRMPSTSEKEPQKQDLHSSATANATASGSPERFWKKNPQTGRFQRPIYIAATRQHVGKTTVSLAVLSGLQKRFDKIGFIKPVGQQHVKVHSNDKKEIRVDKDVELVKEYFHLDHLDYEFMSPIIIPGGYTKVIRECRNCKLFVAATDCCVKFDSNVAILSYGCCDLHM